MAAYRVVQEALTNAHKYGDGTASVALRFNDDGLEIVVANPVGDVTPPDGGAATAWRGCASVSRPSAAPSSPVRVRDGRVFRITATIPRKGAP